MRVVVLAALAALLVGPAHAQQAASPACADWRCACEKDPKSDPCKRLRPAERPGANADSADSGTLHGDGSSTGTSHRGYAHRRGHAPAGLSDAKLTPARVYLKAADIPPKSAAYGIVAFRAKPTTASRAKLLRVCQSFVSYLPPDSTLPSSVTDDQKMLTVWPLDNPDADQAQADDCAFLLDHYDLYAGQAAIRDAGSESKPLTGEGPYLIGWSPSATRGVPDKLVLVVDLGSVDTQAGIDDRFKYWQTEIIEKPEQWRQGFSLEGLRVSLRDFVDHYGADVMSAVALVKP